MFLNMMPELLKSKEQNLFVLIAFSIMIASCGWFVFIGLSSIGKPVVEISPEEYAVREKKGADAAGSFMPFLVILMMGLLQKWSSVLLWTLFGFSTLTWIRFLPEKMRANISGPFKKTLKGIGHILIAILVICGVVSFIYGFFTISTTNFLLLLILWGVLSEKGGRV